MRGGDAPTFRRAQPDVALPAGEGRTHALEFGIGGRDIAAIGRDDRVHQAARHVDRRPGRAEIGDRVIAIEVFRYPVAERTGVRPKQLVQRRDIIGNKGPLLAGEGRCDLGNHFGKIDLKHSKHLQD